MLDDTNELRRKYSYQIGRPRNLGYDRRLGPLEDSISFITVWRVVTENKEHIIKFKYTSYRSMNDILSLSYHYIFNDMYGQRH